MWRKFWPHTLSATLPIRLCYETFFDSALEHRVAIPQAWRTLFLRTNHPRQLCWQLL